MTERVRALEQALRELTAMVRGECPSLLNEDSGGNGDLSCQIEKLLAVDPPPSGASPQAETCGAKKCARPDCGHFECQHIEFIGGGYAGSCRDCFCQEFVAPVSPVEPEPPVKAREMLYLPPSVTRRRAEKAEALVTQLEKNIARQAGFMFDQDEKIVALQAEIERLSAKYNDAHLRALKAEAVEPEPCVWRDCGLDENLNRSGYPGCRRDGDAEVYAGFTFCPYCGAPLKVEKP